jgi:hypothetical protein
MTRYLTSPDEPATKGIDGVAARNLSISSVEFSAAASGLKIEAAWRADIVFIFTIFKGTFNILFKVSRSSSLAILESRDK